MAYFLWLFPRAFKFGRHEVAPPAEFGSLVSGVAFLQHVTAQYLLVVAQLPKLISLAPESGDTFMESMINDYLNSDSMSKCSDSDFIEKVELVDKTA